MCKEAVYDNTDRKRWECTLRFLLYTIAMSALSSLFLLKINQSDFLLKIGIAFGHLTMTDLLCKFIPRKRRAILVERPEIGLMILTSFWGTVDNTNIDIYYLHYLSAAFCNSFSKASTENTCLIWCMRWVALMNGSLHDE